jgi:hypothetical protein
MFGIVGKVGTMQNPYGIRTSCLFLCNVLFVLNVLINIIGWGENALHFPRGVFASRILEVRSKSWNN